MSDKRIEILKIKQVKKGKVKMSEVEDKVGFLKFKSRNSDKGQRISSLEVVSIIFYAYKL